MDKNRKDILNEVCRITRVSYNDINEIIRVFYSVLEENILNGNNCKVEWMNMGSKLYKERICFNPITKERFLQKPHRLPYIEYGVGFKRKFKENEISKENSDGEE